MEAIKKRPPLFDLREKKPYKQYLTVFICALILMLLIVLPFVLIDNGHFIYIGDYNCQQMPFYLEVNESIRNGEFFWNWNTDLGVNLIGSYAFYLIGSPFFWLTLLLPLSWVPGSIPIIICIKTAVAATTSFAFLKRFLKSPNSAFIGCLLYAFSGFAFYNIFFNHFHEIIAFFPLLLLGVEKLMKDGKKGWLALGVFINAVCNYYFFVAEVVFVIIYFVLRLICKSWPKVTWRRLFCFGFEAVLGFVMAAFIVLPAVLTTLQISRASNRLSGWAFLTYYEVQRPFQILQAFFLPPEIVSAPNVFPDAGARWASVTAWLPLFGFAGVWTWLGRRPRDFFSKMCVVLVFMAFIPALNSLFQLMSDNYYTRWFFMLVLLLSLVTMKAFEECSWSEWKAGLGKTAFFALGLALPVALIKNSATGERGLAPNMPLLWAHIAITVVCLLLTFCIIRYAKKDHHDAMPFLGFFLACFVVFFGLFYIGVSRGASSITDHELYVQKNINGRWNMTTKLNDGERIDVQNTETNAPMYWNYPTITAFHSVVPGSIFDFYNNIGVTRDVKSEPAFEMYAVKSLTSVKYLIDGDAGAKNKYADFTYLYDDNGNAVYEYDLYIPMGFSYDSYMLESTLLNYDVNMRDDIMVHTLVVDDSQADLVSGFMEEKDGNDFRVTNLNLYKAVEARRENTCSSFTIDNKGFTATYTASEDKEIVYFSVPYEPGWSATVNGQPAEIVQVNLGFMAVLCDKGENEIRFDFMTPGLIPGAIAAGIALFVLVVYILISKTIRDKNDKPAISSFKALFGVFSGRSAQGVEESADDLTGSLESARDYEDTNNEPEAF